MNRTPLQRILLLPSAVAALLAAGLPAQDRDLLVVEKRKDLAARTRIVSYLRSIRVSVNFEDVTASEFVEYLQSATAKKVNFILSKKAKAAAPKTSFTLKRITLDNLLGLYETKTGLRFTFNSGMVFLKQADEVKEFAYLRIYDVRAAVFKAPVFIGPKLGLRPLDSEGGFTGSTEEEPVSINGFDADRLVDLVKSNVVMKTWDQDGISIDSMNGVLLVRQSVRGHKAVRGMLIKLGAIPAPRVVKRRPVRSKATKKTAKKTRK